MRSMARLGDAMRRSMLLLRLFLEREGLVRGSSGSSGSSGGVVLPPILGISEFLPRPGHDFNNDGLVDVFDEFIEIINAGQIDVDLGVTMWMMNRTWALSPTRSLLSLSSPASAPSSTPPRPASCSAMRGHRTPAQGQHRCGRLHLRYCPLPGPVLVSDPGPVGILERSLLPHPRQPQCPDRDLPAAFRNSNRLPCPGLSPTRYHPR